MVTSRYVPELFRFLFAISGSCLIIFRIICKDLTDQGLLFNGFGSASLEEAGKFPPDFFPQLLKAGDAGDLNQVQVNSTFSLVNVYYYTSGCFVQCRSVSNVC